MRGPSGFGISLGRNATVASLPANVDGVRKKLAEGLDLLLDDRRPCGELIAESCLSGPQTLGPAQRAGVVRGQQLEAVDGVRISDAGAQFASHSKAVPTAIPGL